MKLKAYSYYLKVWQVVLKKSFKKSSLSRVEFTSRAIRGVIVLFTQLLFIKAVYGQSSYISGWTIDQYILLTGIFNFINYSSWSLFTTNIWRLEEKIIKGEFDFILLKPTGSIFQMAFSEFFLDDAISAAAGLVLIGFYIYRNIGDLTVIYFVAGLFAIIPAYIIWFSMELMATSINFIVVRTSILELKKNLTEMARVPVDMWGKWIRIMMFTFIPVAFFSSVPVKIFSGLNVGFLLVSSYVVAFIFLFLARTVWYKSLRFYGGQNS